MNEFENALFETGSIKIADADKQFWYTSGTIGPYFVNTHFLYRSEKDANGLLGFIDENINDKLKLAVDLKKKTLDFYNTNSLYKKVIDIFTEKLSSNAAFTDAEYITGGERRDWFFSIAAAYTTGKKHLYIFKDLSIYDEEKEIKDIRGKSVCHISDLVTQASSYKRAWMPAIKNINGRFTINASIVDRDEGGKKYFTENNIDNLSMVSIDNNFLDMIRNNNIINEDQLKLIEEFKKDPISYGRDYLLKNKNFLKDSLSDDKSRSKAERCVKENPYTIDFKEILDIGTLSELLR